MAEKTLTEKQLLFLGALPETRGDVRAAMKIAGYADTTSTTEVINPLKDKILDIAKELLATNSVKAVTSLLDVLDAPNVPGNPNKLAAAKEVLDRAGVIKEEQKEKQNNVKVTFYLPEKNKASDE